MHDVFSSEEAGKNLDGTTQTTDAFQRAQEKSYNYIKAVGNKWLITDLITVGSPLTHGIPSERRILQEGDLINIDVSAELNGFFSDNGGSFVLGNDKYQYQNLVNASKEILYKAIHNIKGGVRISDIGLLIETEAKKRGYKVIRNLTGHEEVKDGLQ